MCNIRPSRSNSSCLLKTIEILIPTESLFCLHGVHNILLILESISTKFMLIVYMLKCQCKCVLDITDYRLHVSVVLNESIVMGFITRINSIRLIGEHE